MPIPSNLILTATSLYKIKLRFNSILHHTGDVKFEAVARILSVQQKREPKFPLSMSCTFESNSDFPSAARYKTQQTKLGLSPCVLADHAQNLGDARPSAMIAELNRTNLSQSISPLSLQKLLENSLVNLLII